MSTNCCGFLRKKSKSLSMIESQTDSLNLNNTEVPKSSGTLTRKKSYSNALNNLESFNAKAYCEAEKIEEELIQEFEQEGSIGGETEKETSDYKTSAKNFLGQSVANIRAKRRQFDDSRFLRFVSSIVENQESQLYISLVSRLKAKSIVELNNLIKWKRIQVL